MKYITREEFDRIPVQRGKKRVAPEFDVLEELEIDQGIMVPCRWEHGQGCKGLPHAYNSARRSHQRVKISCKCWEKYIYVMRVA